MAPALTRAETASALAERTAERDTIQANLLELDASFGKRLLAGAALTGVTKLQWDAAVADLAAVWEIFAVYASVVQRAVETLDGTRRPSVPLLEELAVLLTGPAVVLAGREVPLAQRQLTGSDRPREHVTLDQAVSRMTTAYSRVTQVVAVAERVWNEVSARLDEIAAVLGPAIQPDHGPADEGLRREVSAVDAELKRTRELLNSDPLELWQDEQVAAGGLYQLLERARAVGSLTAELTKLHEDAARRIAEAASLVAAAQDCEQHARSAYEEAAQKISANQLPALPATTAPLTERLAGLDPLRAAGRLPRLATELAAIEKEAAAAAVRWKEAEGAARASLARRSELRGLLDAYRAKAGKLGAAENPQLTRRYQVARDSLWSAPCDLAASADAVRSYQQAVLAVQKGEP